MIKNGLTANDCEIYVNGFKTNFNINNDDLQAGYEVSNDDLHFFGRSDGVGSERCAIDETFLDSHYLME